MQTTQKYRVIAPYGNDFLNPDSGVKIKNSQLVHAWAGQATPTQDNFRRRHTSTSSDEFPATPRTTRRGSRNTDESSENPWVLQRQNSSPDFRLNMIGNGYKNGHSEGNKFGSMNVLPQIQQNGHLLVQETLLRKNPNVSDDEERDMNEELGKILSVVGDNRLEAIRTEIRQYDPYDNGVADSSSVKRILLQHLKHVVIHERTWQQILKLFSRNPEKPREIRYKAMLQHFGKIVAQQKQVDQTSQNEMQSPTTLDVAFNERGDAKLVLDIELCLKSAGVESVDIEKLTMAFTASDRRNSGFLNRREVESVFRVMRILESLSPVLERILARCDKNGDQQFQWNMITKFIQKAQPMHYSSPANLSGSFSRGGAQPRRDMQSHFVLSNCSNGQSTPSLAAPRQQTASVPAPAMQSKQPTAPQNLQNDVVQSPKYQNGTVERETNRRIKAQRLDLVQEQIRKLQIEADQLKRELGQDPSPQRQVSPLDTSFTSSSKSVQRLLDALHKMDTAGTGWIPQLKARQVVQQYNDLHQLGLNPRFIQSVIMLSSDEGENAVSIESLSQYLRKAAE